MRAPSLLSSLIGVMLLAQQASAQETKPAPARIGVYDSRLVAYAHFSTPAFQQKLNAQVGAVKQARAAGDEVKAKELETAVKEVGRRSHRQVFSTAPIDNVLSDIKERLPAIQKEANVTLLVSKWDEVSLKEHVQAEKVDVTDLLIREFKPGEKQWKVIEDLRSKKPVALDEAGRDDH